MKKTITFVLPMIGWGILTFVTITDLPPFKSAEFAAVIFSIIFGGVFLTSPCLLISYIFILITKKRKLFWNMSSILSICVFLLILTFIYLIPK
mgnify:CR=1 FL=1